MQILSVSKHEKKPGKFTVTFNAGTEIDVSTEQIADFGLYSGKELTDDEYSELIGKLREGSSKARAVRILGTRNLSAREIKKRLVNKGDSDETAQSTVEWLQDIGAINDAEYAVSIAKHYSGKGYGEARIRDELFRRGIPRELWDDALLGIAGAEDAAQYYLEKKFRGSYDREDLRKAADMLCRRGYSYEDARAAVLKYAENIQENSEE